MSERILRALMQLFAIIARVDEIDDDSTAEEITSSKGRKVVELFLRQELTPELVQQYLLLFDQHLNAHQGSNKSKDGKRKRTSVNSVKILRICSEINEELTQRQKIIVLVRLIEFIHANDHVNEQELEFVNTVSDAFNVKSEEYQNIFDFVEASVEKLLDIPSALYITGQQSDRWEKAKTMVVEGMDAVLGILRIESVNILFMRYLGEEQITVNGQIVPNDRQHIFTQGSSIRTPKISPIYYSDVISSFLSDKTEEKINFKVNNVVFRFPNNAIGLHNIDFEENSGRLIGIMGGSGAGKSTLLNVLNGNYTPTEGAVTINGIDIHRQKQEIEGIIGFVSQDDLLIEELTVFQNLFFNAKLCFKDLSDKQIARKVLSLLHAIGLYESKDLKVGNPLEKTISGGQRKRLNISLELIREPSVLFVDEPTSGLSSRDSENIMDLLKELALKGKLVFVVIHQPSSEIFKMFDKLFLLDQGGFPIFYGNPIDSVVHFKTLINHANCNERECPNCGNVNPEQIFNIIEAKVVDEFGNQTSKRKTPPEEWNRLYLESKQTAEAEVITDKPKISFKIPNKLQQFKVFFLRDVLAKLTNKQYLMINAIEAPVLALILAFFVKFFNFSKGSFESYRFDLSENLPQFLFIAVVVALFLGLTVAAEEIIKDRKILQRESFLNLSKGSYLTSKISIMFLISAIQTMTFVLIGNLILDIKGMWFEYWLVLFSTSCFANILGLNISASFNSAKVIYILIPIMIIPQLLFSGVIVKFDRLNPMFAKESSVPWIGNIMASRWAYEALAVTQYTNNRYEAPFFDINQRRSEAAWKRDYWLPELRNKLDILNNYVNDTDHADDVNKAFDVLANEIGNEEKLYDPSLNFVCGCVEELKAGKFSSEQSGKIGKYLQTLREIYTKDVNTAMKEHGEKIKAIGEEQFRELKRTYFNESLSDFVTNRNELTKILEKDGRLYQKSDPIYHLPRGKGITQAHFYSPVKYLFGKRMSTLVANTIMIWFMTFLLIIALYFDFFRTVFELPSRIKFRRRSSAD
jgi:ABC transport system ATP-binding/permease protein